MAENIFTITPGTTPITPNYSVLSGVGDPNLAISDTDLTGAATGSVFFRRDGAAGVEVYQKASSTPTWRPNVITPVFDVRAYGAKGDGSNDTPALGAAIAAAVGAITSTSTGAVVYVPPGTYVYNSTLLLTTSGLELVLAAGATLKYSPVTGNNAIELTSGCTVRGASGLISANAPSAAAASMIQCTVPGNAIEVNYDCLVTDVVLQGSGEGDDSGVTGGDAYDVVIQRCTITGYGDGVNGSAGGGRWTVVDNIVHDCLIDGIYLATSTDCIVANNHVYNIGHCGIDMNSSPHIIANNWVYNCGTADATDGCGIVLQPASGTNTNQCVITGNRVYSTASSPGIALRLTTGQQCTDNVVSNNVVFGCANGIEVNGVGNTGYLDRNIIIGNIVRVNVGGSVPIAGIYVGGSDVNSLQGTLVANNMVTANATGSAGGYGIEVAGNANVQDTQINNNVVLGNGNPASQANQIFVGSGPVRTTIAGNKTETTDNTYTITGSALNLSSGVLQVNAQKVVGARLASVAIVTGSAGGTYTSVEQGMINNLVTSVNALIARLNSTTGHGLIT
jgi:parallel beta-helix repeat protein